MKALVLFLTFSLVTVSCNEIKPQIKVSFINLTGMTLNDIQTSQGKIGTLLPQQTSSKVKFPELKSMTDPQLEIKLTAEIDGHRYNQLPEFRVFDPASYSVSPGDYVGEIRVSASNIQLQNYSLNNSIKGFFVKLIKQP